MIEKNINIRISLGGIKPKEIQKNSQTHIVFLQILLFLTSIKAIIFCAVFVHFSKRHCVQKRQTTNWYYSVLVKTTLAL